MAALDTEQGALRHEEHEAVQLPATPNTSQPSLKECSKSVDCSEDVLNVLQRCKAMLLFALDSPSIKWSELHDKDGCVNAGLRMNGSVISP